MKKGAGDSGDHDEGGQHPILTSVRRTSLYLPSFFKKCLAVWFWSLRVWGDNTDDPFLTYPHSIWQPLEETVLVSLETAGYV